MCGRCTGDESGTRVHEEHEWEGKDDAALCEVGQALAGHVVVEDGALEVSFVSEQQDDSGSHACGRAEDGNASSNMGNLVHSGEHQESDRGTEQNCSLG